MHSDEDYACSPYQREHVIKCDERGEGVPYLALQSKNRTALVTLLQAIPKIQDLCKILRVCVCVVCVDDEPVRVAARRCLLTLRSEIREREREISVEV